MSSRPGLRDWRDAVEAGIQHCLSEDFNPDAGLPTEAFLQERGFEPPYDAAAFRKTQRYTLLGAALRLCTETYVSGEGANATVSNFWPSPSLRTRLLSEYFDAIKDAWMRAATRTSVLEPRLNQFFRILGTVSTAEQAQGNAVEVMHGGVMPAELRNFVDVSSHVLQTSEVSADLGPDERRIAAHTLLPLVTSRSSINVDRFTDMPTWQAAREATLRVYDQAQSSGGDPRGRVYQLLIEDASPLFVISKKLVEATATGPTLKCPAHQRGIGDKTALQQQIHAGINAAAEWGMYDQPLPDSLVFPRQRIGN